MDIFVSSFGAIALLFFLGTAGFLLVSRKFLPEQALSYLSPLVLELALPALIFTKFLNLFDPTNTKSLLIPIYFPPFLLAILGPTFLFSYFMKKKNRAEFRVSLFFQNAAFIPIVLISTVYGPNSSKLVDLFLFTMLYPAVFFNTYHLFFPHKRGCISWNKIFHPVLLSTVIAILIKLSGFETMIPVFMLKGIAMIGNMTIPLLMLVIGGTVYLDFRDKGNIEFFETFKFVVIKNFIFPAVMLLVIYLFEIEKGIAIILLIQAAVPPLSALPILIDRANGNRIIANQFLTASFAVSIISIPLFMYLLDKI